MISRYTVRVSLAAGLFVLLAMGSFAQGQGGLVPTGPPPDATFVFTGDVIGYLDPCG
jgi:hypothetical protein